MMMRSLPECRNGCLIAVDVSRWWSLGTSDNKVGVIARLDRAILYAAAGVV
jgi:hypothetical protein